jgi:hypothetical protein
MSMPDYPPDPNPPTTTPPPPPTGNPASGYTVPQQFTPPAPPPSRTDPLVLPSGSNYGGWFSAVMDVAKRSWKSALFTSLGVVVPLAIVSLIAYAIGAGGTLTIFLLFSHPGLGFISFIGALFIKLVLTIAAAFVASAAWAAGAWALVTEAKTGRPANIQEAYQYGLRRAMSLFPWTVVAGFLCVIGLMFFYIPGLYLAFAFSMFGFVATFERGQQPLTRSLNMLHRNIGPSLARVGTLFGIFLVYNGIVSLFFGIFTITTRVVAGNTPVYGIGEGFIQMIATIVLAPAVAVLMIGLLVTYAELRAQEAPTSTDDLAAQLG